MRIGSRWRPSRWYPSQSETWRSPTHAFSCCSLDRGGPTCTCARCGGRPTTMDPRGRPWILLPNDPISQNILPHPCFWLLRRRACRLCGSSSSAQPARPKVKVLEFPSQSLLQLLLGPFLLGGRAPVDKDHLEHGLRLVFARVQDKLGAIKGSAPTSLQRSRWQTPPTNKAS